MRTFDINVVIFIFIPTFATTFIICVSIVSTLRYLYTSFVTFVINIVILVVLVTLTTTF